MKTKKMTMGMIAAVLLSGSALVFAADAAKAATTKADSVKKPLGKLTCEDFIAIDDIIKPQYVIAAAAHTKGGKAKNVVIDVVGILHSSVYTFSNYRRVGRVSESVTRQIVLSVSGYG